jgi:hypothetical protein
MRSYSARDQLRGFVEPDALSVVSNWGQIQIGLYWMDDTGFAPIVDYATTPSQRLQFDKTYRYRFGSSQELNEQ